MGDSNTVQCPSSTGAKGLFTHTVLLYDKEQLFTVPALKESSMTGEMSFAAVRIFRSASCLIPLSSFRKESVFITSRITFDAGSSWVKQLQGNKTAISNNLNLEYIFLCLIHKQDHATHVLTFFISLQGRPLQLTQSVLHQDPFHSFIITPRFAFDSF
jgi:hypothetical protein